MSGVDWTPALAVLAAGLAIGALVLWRVMPRGAVSKAPSGAPLALRDLLGKYEALLAQLRELDDIASKRTPEQVAAERHALEHAAARALRELESLGKAAPAADQPKKKKAAAAAAAAAPPPPVAAPASALQGFLWGVGSVAVLGLLFYFVSQQSRSRPPGASATGETPAQAAAAPDDAELREQRAAVEKNPQDVDERLELVRLYLVRQDMMSVFQETQAVLKQQPGNARALSYQALVRLAMGQAPQAEAMLKQALAKDPKLLDAYLHLMLVYVRSGKQAEADKVLKDVQQRFPGQAESFRQLLSEMRARMKDEPQSAQAPAQGEDPHARVGVVGAPSGAVSPGAASDEKKVSGTLELDPSIRGKSFTGAIVFVTLREGGFGAGPPLAAKRLPLRAFPMPFQIGASDSMTGEPLPNDLLIEARIDTDGDPMTRPKSDPYGSADRVPVGSKDVKLVLKPRPSS